VRNLSCALAVLLVVLAATACAPRFVLPGPPVTTPTLEPNHVILSDGVRLPLRTWRAETDREKAVLLALHGFNDYGTFIAEAAWALAEKGVTTYAYDQRGFGGAPHAGRWAGTDAYIKDLTVISRLIRAKHFGVPFYLLGESMGGAVVLAAVTGNDPPEADGVILSAPAVWGWRSMPFYQTVPLRMAAHLFPGWVLTGEGLDITPSDNREMLIALGRDPLVIKGARVDTLYGLTTLMDRAYGAGATFNENALILYGEKDEIIPWGPTRDLLAARPAEALKNQKVALYQNGYHMLLRDLQGDVVLTDLMAWLADPKAPLPSKADANAAKIEPRQP